MICGFTSTIMTSSVIECKAWLLHALHCGVQLHYVVVFPMCGCKVAKLSAAGVGLCQPCLAHEEVVTLYVCRARAAAGRTRVYVPHGVGWQALALL